MKYRKESDDKNLKIIPFEYNISEACIEEKFSGIVLSPLRVEPRIEVIKLSRNYLKRKGFIEIAKLLLLNKNIKNIELNACIIRTYYIDALNNTLGLFDNNSVEVLNLSRNFLKEDCSEYLANILTHFKNIKIINLSQNILKCGISSFLITLKKLYRQGKSDLESLNLNQCALDDISYYELEELLKSKYCKLKKLYLNWNNIPSNANFLKKLKRNRSLTKIYFNNSNIRNNDTDDIMRIISNSNIEFLCLHRNKINDFSQCLRIIYRTRLIKREKEKIKGDPNLYNLDLSYNRCFNKNNDKIDLLKTSIEETTLYCLDTSFIIYGKIDEEKDRTENIVYINSANKLISQLDSKQKEYNNAIRDRKFNLIDQENLRKINYNKKFRNLDTQINDIIQDKNAKYEIFLIENAEYLISENEEIRKETIINGKEDEDKYKEVLNNLVQYMKLKRINIKFGENQQIIKSKKMTII